MGIIVVPRTARLTSVFFSLGTTLYLHSTYLHSYSVAEAQHTLFSLVLALTHAHINTHALTS